jgi:hypothetical protein
MGAGRQIGRLSEGDEPYAPQRTVTHDVDGNDDLVEKGREEHLMIAIRKRPTVYPPPPEHVCHVNSFC